MKVLCMLFVFVLASELGFCQSAKTEKKQDDEIIIVEQRTNRKYNVTATLYGVNFRYGENNEKATKIITHIVFRDDQSKAEVKYRPIEGNNGGTTGVDSIVTPDFYFTEIWSPNEEYLILPIGKFEGFGIFEAKDALKNIKSNKYFDTLKVKSENSGWFRHDFEKWENDSAFSFRAGLYGDMFAFKYNAAKSELYCYEGDCEESDFGINNKGKIKAIKKGDIAPTKIH